MKIQIDNKNKLIFGDQTLPYDLYFLNSIQSKKYEAATLGGVLKNMILVWAKVLKSLSENHRPLFLPFSYDDDWVDCLEATRHEDKLSVRRVRVLEPGWAFDFGHLEEFISSPHEIEEGSPEIFGEYDRNEIIDALLNAEVVDR